MNLGIETETVEYKRSTSELREGIESIASILNKHGHGVLYFGVRSNGEVIGQQVTEKTLRDISQAIGNRIEPKIYPEIRKLSTNAGKDYIRIEFSGFETPYACDGRYRIRTADEDLPMSRAKLQEMMRDAENRSNPWDSRSSSKSIDIVDEELLRRYVERGLAARRIPFSYTNSQDVLAHLGLLSDDGNLTNAAVVCFTNRPEIGLRMGILGNSTRTDIRDNQQVSGSLFHLVDAAETYIVNNTRRAFIIDGSSIQRKEVPEIPSAAVREALMNAFCHRRYEDLGAVQVDIYWDKVDIYSPGRFPLGLSPDDYLSGEEAASKPRNPLIARTLFRSNDIEAYGTGLLRMVDACKRQDVPVHISQNKNSVHVCFERQEGIAASQLESAGNPPINRRQTEKSADKFEIPPINRRQTEKSADKSSQNVANEKKRRKRVESPKETLRGNERMVRNYMINQDWISVSQISSALGIAERTVRDVMKRLVDKGIVIPEGENRNRTYKIKP